MDLTQEDPTYSDYKKVKAGVERLRKKGVEFGQLETDLLDHHRAGYMPNAPYSWWSLLVWGEQLITLWALTKHKFTKVYSSGGICLQDKRVLRFDALIFQA